MGMAEDDAEEGRVALLQAFHRWDRDDVLKTGVQRTPDVENDPLAVVLDLHAAPADLVGPSVDLDLHPNASTVR